MMRMIRTEKSRTAYSPDADQVWKSAGGVLDIRRRSACAGPHEAHEASDPSVPARVEVCWARQVLFGE